MSSCSVYVVLVTSVPCVALSSLQVNEDHEWNLRSQDAVIYAWADENENAGIAAIAADGSRRVDLVTSKGARDPDWSGATRKLLFVAELDEASQIFVLDPGDEEAKPVQLTSSEGPKRTPRWSPDGNQILFAAQHEGSSHLHTMNADGSNVVRLAPGMMPDWSPDGRQIVSVVGQIPQLQILEGPDFKPRQVKASAELRACFYPTWSPRGEMIAYGLIVHVDSNAKIVNYDVLLIAPDGGETRQVPDEAGIEFPYTWAGEHQLLIASDEDGPVDLYLLKIDSKARKRLTRDARRETSADWAPGFFESAEAGDSGAASTRRGAARD